MQWIFIWGVHDNAFFPVTFLEKCNYSLNLYFTIIIINKTYSTSHFIPCLRQIGANSAKERGVLGFVAQPTCNGVGTHLGDGVKPSYLLYHPRLL